MMNRRSFLSTLLALPAAAKALALTKFNIGQVTVPLWDIVPPAPSFQEFIPGLRRMGPMTMTLSANAPTTGLMDAWRKGELVPLSVVFPDGVCWDLEGFVQEMKVIAPGFARSTWADEDPADAVAELEMSIRPTGAPRIRTEPIPQHEIVNDGPAVVIVMIDGEPFELRELTPLEMSVEMIDVTGDLAFLTHGGGRRL
jgi:hypothetical protein